MHVSSTWRQPDILFLWRHHLSSYLHVKPTKADFCVWCWDEAYFPRGYSTVINIRKSVFMWVRVYLWFLKFFYWVPLIQLFILVLISGCLNHCCLILALMYSRKGGHPARPFCILLHFWNFSPLTFSHGNMLRKGFGFHKRGCYWHLVGRGQGCSERDRAETAMGAGPELWGLQCQWCWSTGAYGWASLLAPFFKGAWAMLDPLHSHTF
jgi:hypothetical protein